MLRLDRFQCWCRGWVPCPRCQSCLRLGRLGWAIRDTSIKLFAMGIYIRDFKRILKQEALGFQYFTISLPCSFYFYFFIFKKMKECALCHQESKVTWTFLTKSTLVPPALCWLAHSLVQSLTNLSTIALDRDREQNTFPSLIMDPIISQVVTTQSSLTTKDYSFLEDVYRIADNASRSIESARTEFKPKTRRLAQQCKLKNIQLEFMPPGLKRHDSNRTLFLNKFKCISWTVEWCFEETKTTLLDHRYFLFTHK